MRETMRMKTVSGMLPRGGNRSFSHLGAKALAGVLVLAMLLSVNIPGMNSVANVKAAGLGNGATYYVSNRGSDSNNGTSMTSAWATLNKVNATTFQPGDSILFEKGGVWTGTLYPKGSGSAGAGNSIYIDAYGTGGNPIINGGGSRNGANGNSPESAAVYLYNQQYWEIRNLEITNIDPTDIDTGASSRNNGRLADRLRRGVYIYVDLPAGAAADPTIAKDEKGSPVLSHIVLENLNIHDVKGMDKFSGDGKGTGGIYVWVAGSLRARIDDLQILNNTITDCTREGISLLSNWQSLATRDFMTNVNISGNVLNRIGGDGIIAIGLTGPYIQYNLCGNANCNGAWQQMDSGGALGAWAVGLMTFFTDAATFQYNEVYNTRTTDDGEGIDVDGQNNGNIVQYNYTHDNEGGAYLVMVDTYANSRNFNTTIRYNVSQNDCRNVFSIQAVQNLSIYNNTVYFGWNMQTAIAAFNSSTVYATNVDFTNNLFIGQGARALATPNTGVTNLVCANNWYYGNANCKPLRGETDYTSRTGDPGLMVNIASLPSGWAQFAVPAMTVSQLKSRSGILPAYQLSGASPLIDKGVVPMVIRDSDRVVPLTGAAPNDAANLARCTAMWNDRVPLTYGDGAGDSMQNVNNDFWGNPALSGSAPDIGACEYQGSASSVTPAVPTASNVSIALADTVTAPGAAAGQAGFMLHGAYDLSSADCLSNVSNGTSFSWTRGSTTVSTTPYYTPTNADIGSTLTFTVTPRNAAGAGAAASAAIAVTGFDLSAGSGFEPSDFPAMSGARYTSLRSGQPIEYTFADLQNITNSASGVSSEQAYAGTKAFKLSGQTGLLYTAYSDTIMNAPIYYTNYTILPNTYLSYRMYANNTVSTYAAVDFTYGTSNTKLSASTTIKDMGGNSVAASGGHGGIPTGQWVQIIVPLNSLAGQKINQLIASVNPKGAANVPGAQIGVYFDNIQILDNVPETSPSASLVKVTGSLKAPNLLTAAYTYYSATGVAEGASAYKWQTAASSGGPWTDITGANAKTYATSASDVGKYIRFAVTPVSVTPLTGDTVYSAAVGPISEVPADDVPPVADNVQVTPKDMGYQIGGATTRGSLIGTCDYSDANGDIENGTTYQWYVSAGAGGPFTAISGATGKSVMIASSMWNQYVELGVTPANDNAVGTETLSAPVHVFSYIFETENDMVLGGPNGNPWLKNNVAGASAVSGSASSANNLVRIDSNITDTAKQTGTLTLTLSGITAGNYDVRYYYYDENDGNAPYSVTLNGVPIGAWVANQNFGSADPIEQTRTFKLFPNVALQNGDVIVITATANAANEWCRSDCVTLTPVSGTPLDSAANLAIGSAAKVASWSAVPAAASYKVQLYFNGAALGSAVTATTNSYDFSSAIAANGAGTYTFDVTTVPATGNGVSLPSPYAICPTTSLAGGTYVYVPFTVDKSALQAKIDEAGMRIEADYTIDSWAALASALAAANGVMADSQASQQDVDDAAAALQAALVGLRTATLDCAVKSMAVKIAKPVAIPCTWDGVGALTFTSSNPAVCGVNGSGVLSPMKAGIAVITIAAPDGTKVVFAVTVTA